MDRFGLIGYPISHSPSPDLFRAAYAGKWEYDLIQSPDFEECWTRFAEGYKGINITIPHKVAALSKVDVVHPECKAAGATNLVVKTDQGYEAYNSDVLAVRHILRRECPEGGMALIAGDGGAGKAAAAAAKACGMDVVICNRSTGHAKGIRPLGELGILAPVADILIYTLPCSVPEANGIECACVLEANYHTPMLRGHSGIGRYIPGGEWLTLQAELGYSLLTGEEPDVQAIRDYSKKSLYLTKY